MLRTISEIAAAITVWSPGENPTRPANSRPRCRAPTTSTSDATITVMSSDTTPPAFHFAVEEGEPLLQVECSRDPLQREAQLDHRERDIGLDADDDRLGAAQP